MSISRRGFLKSILAAGVAPAIVRAESLMKIWIHPQNIQIINTFDPFVTDMVGDYTIETFAAPVDEWVHIAVTRKFGELSMFLNGEKASDARMAAVTGGQILSYVDGKLSFKNPSQEMKLCDVRITDGVARSPDTLISNFKELT
jgi:hypothetical protein